MHAYIPEPVHRVTPKPIASGISFRTLPKTSCEQIRKTCEFYVKKGAGHYTPHSKAGRYLYDLATEVTKLVNDLEDMWITSQQKQQHKLDFYDQIISEYRKCFGDETENTPQQLNEELRKVKQQNKKLYDMLQIEKLKHAEVELEMHKIVNEHHRTSREATSRIINKEGKRLNIDLNILHDNVSQLDSSMLSDKNDLITKLELDLKSKNDIIRELNGQISNYKHDIVHKLKEDLNRTRREWKREITFLKQELETMNRNKVNTVRNIVRNTDVE
jgi:acetolactate synthase small subunit